MTAAPQDKQGLGSSEATDFRLRWIQKARCDGSGGQ
jgi:hypothetical protein